MDKLHIVTEILNFKKYNPKNVDSIVKNTYMNSPSYANTFGLAYNTLNPDKVQPFCELDPIHIKRLLCGKPK